MGKFFIYFGFFAIVLFAFSSCSRVLRPGAKRGSNTNTGNTPGNTGSGKTVYNAGSFTGTLVKDIVFTSAINYSGTNQQLGFDVYKPANAEGKKFPAIFLFHGGTFIGGDKSNLSSTCSKLANNGYVVISVNYRLGWGAVSRATASCNDSNKLKQAYYRATQDAHSAIRYAAQHAEEYSIDKDWIFLGGHSAGAIIALTAAYLREEDANGFFPQFSKVLGNLDKTAGGAGSDFTVRGVISMWGAFIDPQLITSKTALPTIFFQGEKDKAVPFNNGPFMPCASATEVYGTYHLYSRLTTLGETAIAHVDPQGGHGVFEEDFRINNILCFLNDVKQGIKKQVYLTGVQSSCNK